MSLHQSQGGCSQGRLAGGHHNSIMQQRLGAHWSSLARSNGMCAQHKCDRGSQQCCRAHQASQIRWYPAGVMAWLFDVVLGAISTGVNLPTYVLLNLLLALAFGALLLLLLVSIHTNPALVPHVIVLLLLAAGLWISIIWFISNVGLVDSSQQQKQLFGQQEGGEAQQDTREADGSQPSEPETKKEQ